MNRIICAHALDAFKAMPSESVDLILTSPPYWSLRDYGQAANGVWDETSNHEHVWKDIVNETHHGEGFGANKHIISLNRETTSGFCECGAWKGQLGLEPTPQLFVKHLVDVFREAKRVLKKTGAFYLNIGDSYAGSKVEGFPAKCRIGIPWRVALALIDDGWILRNDIIWNKPNHMPAPFKDRFTNGFEYIFFFTKSPRYYFNLDAVRVLHQLDPQQMEYRRKLWTERGEGTEMQFSKQKRRDAGYKGKFTEGNLDPEKFNSPRARTQRHKRQMYQYYALPGSQAERTDYETLHATGSQGVSHPKGKNPGDVWTIPTQPYPGSHFAVFPFKLCYTPILSSCPPDGVVLDPFAGSGTVAEAVEILNRTGKLPTPKEQKAIVKGQVPTTKVANRTWIMVEVVPDYVKLIRGRVDKYGEYEFDVSETLLISEPEPPTPEAILSTPIPELPKPKTYHLVVRDGKAVMEWDK